MRFLLSSSTFQAVFMTPPSECPAVAVDCVDQTTLVIFCFFCPLSPASPRAGALKRLLQFPRSPCAHTPSGPPVSGQARVQMLPRLLSNICPLVAPSFPAPRAVDLAGVVPAQEAAERFVFLCCFDLFNLLLRPLSIPTLSPFQNQSSCLLYTRYTYKGLCPFLNHQVISVFTIYLLSLQITFFFP